MNPIRDTMRSNALGIEVPVTEHEYERQKEIDRARVAGEPSFHESDLPDHYYQAQRLRASGARICDLAKYFGKNRGTIHRWLLAVDQESARLFRRRNPMERIMELLAHCEHLEADARRMMARSDQDTTRNMHCREARQLMKMRMDLLRLQGLLEMSQGGPSLPRDIRTSSKTKKSADLAVSPARDVARTPERERSADYGELPPRNSSTQRKPERSSADDARLEALMQHVTQRMLVREMEAEANADHAELRKNKAR